MADDSEDHDYGDSYDSTDFLGYQTSQLLALLFLDEFDHIVKEKYGVKKYGRYMDDFLAIHPSKEFLKNLLADFRVFMGSYGLELNEKTGIFPLRNGIDFLGFHSYLTETGGVVQKLRKDGIDRIKKNIKIWRVEYPAGNITKEKILEKFGSWDAHAAHGDTHALRTKYAKQVEEIIGEKVTVHRKINSTREVRAKRRVKQMQNIYKKQHRAQEQSGAFSPVPRPAYIPPWQ